VRSSTKVFDELEQPLLKDEKEQYDEESEEMNFDKVPNFAPRATTKFINKLKTDAD